MTATAMQNGHENGHVAEAVCSPSYPVAVRNLNPLVVAAEYAVRGPIVAKAREIEEELRKGAKLPFNNVVYCNIGNPQQLGQPPITFFRQILALCDYPDILQHKESSVLFPADVITRAKTILESLPGGTGAYSESNGARACREAVAAGIAERDGFAADPEDIFLTDGASPAVHNTMKLLIRDTRDCILTPIPQYPLYSACIALYGGTLLPYHLVEEQDWQLDLQELKSQVDKARSEGKCVRALVVINPGNPTGQVLERGNQVEVVRFCEQEGLVLLADEVYQENVYAKGKSFTSFKKVVRELGSEVSLISYHSISKGFYGECGRRGGYMEVLNFKPEVRDQFLKIASINLCSNVPGQIVMSLVMQPPKKGDPSYPLFAEQRESLLSSLARRAHVVYESLSKLEGVTLNHPEGALYVFPQIQLPEKAVQTARKAGQSPDFLYCLEMLENTGIVTVPGSGFGQKNGTYHFRTTILPPEDQMHDVAQRMGKFHQEFMDKYRD